MYRCVLYVDVELVGQDVRLGLKIFRYRKYFRETNISHLEQEGLEAPGGQEGGHGQGER